VSLSHSAPPLSILVSDFGRLAFSRPTPTSLRLADLSASILTSREERVENGRGEAAVRLRATGAGLGCPSAKGGGVTRVRVGCPPGRSVRFLPPDVDPVTAPSVFATLTARRSRELAALEADFGATGTAAAAAAVAEATEAARVTAVPANVTTLSSIAPASCEPWSSGSETFTVDGAVRNPYGLKAEGEGKTMSDIPYDFARWGCPVQVFHETTGFRIRLGLFEYERLIEVVEAEFYLEEVHGRWDWSGNTTSAQAGCNRAAVSRTDLVRVAEDAPDDDGERSSVVTGAVTPATYRSCFQDPSGELDVPRGTYEIFNSTGRNALRFLRSGRGGVFVFRATVVDPFYSYCSLETEFAIDAFGEPLRSSTILIILAAVVAVMLMLLAATYIYYRKQHMRGVKED
jgi:hypothetical protein